MSEKIALITLKFYYRVICQKKNADEMANNKDPDHNAPDLESMFYVFSEWYRIPDKQVRHMFGY